MGLGDAAAAADPFSEAALAETLARYVGFGVKHSGSAEDNACGDWMEATLRDAGFRTWRQSYDAPYFTPAESRLSAGDVAEPLVPLAPVVPATVTGPLALQSGATPRGAIAVARLAHRRWSTAVTPEVRRVIDQAARDGAAALLIVTEGPTGKAVALNVEADARWPLPVAVLAPDSLRKLTMGATATYAVRGEAGRRPCFNVLGELDRGAGKRIVISTPRSAWTIAGGERGPGVAVWTALARWAPRALRRHDLTFLCNSGHEYENLGAARLLHGEHAPPVAGTHLWAHLGAGFAARDWHEYGPLLMPLPSADPQRFLFGSEALVPTLAEAFRGLPGLEVARPTSLGVAGELGNIVGAGYPRVFGMFGAHRFHHVAEDDARCIDAAMVRPVALATRNAVLRLSS